MSALPPEADIPQRNCDVRFVPKADIGASVYLCFCTRRHVRDKYIGYVRLHAGKLRSVGASRKTAPASLRQAEVLAGREGG